MRQLTRTITNLQEQIKRKDISLAEKEKNAESMSKKMSDLELKSKKYEV